MVFFFRRDLTYYVKLGEHDLSHDGALDQIPVLQGHIPHSLYQASDLIETALITSQTNISNNSDPALTSPDPEITSVEQVIEVDFKEVHPHHPRRYHYHDIAVVRLKKPVSSRRKD